MKLKQHHVAAILRGIDHDIKACDRISPAKGKILADQLDIVKDYVTDAANVVNLGQDGINEPPSTEVIA